MNVVDELSKIVINLIRFYSFYGHVLTQLNRVFVSDSRVCPTMGVGKTTMNDVMINLYVNVDYMDKLYTEHGLDKAFIHFNEVLKHETLHVCFGHLSYNMPDKERSQCASDLAVNSYCDRNKLLPNPDGGKGGVFPEDYNMPNKQSFMWYYNQLLKNDKFQNQCKNGNFGNGGSNSQNIDDHGLWKQVQGNNIDAELIKDLVRKSVEICKQTQQWGDVSGSLKEQIGELLKPKKQMVQWKSVLRQFVASTIENNLRVTIKRKSRRFGTRPGLKKDFKLNVAVGIDTSGSVSSEQLNIFFGELYYIHKAGAKIRIFQCDTKIQDECDYECFTGKIAGRGGTDLEPVLKKVAEERYNALIFFTDFYTPKITTNYHIPILWMLSECNYRKGEYPYPYGAFLHINQDMTCEIDR